MREIKFRAWHEEFKKYAYWNVISGLMKGGEIGVQQPLKPFPANTILTTYTDVSTRYYRNINIFTHKDWIVEQYTGLKDKNGKEIYEGDIVDCSMSFNGGVLPHRGEIIYLNGFGAFATKNQGGETLLHNHVLSSFEIIGNIHENPELLKEG